MIAEKASKYYINNNNLIDKIGLMLCFALLLLKRK